MSTQPFFMPYVWREGYKINLSRRGLASTSPYIGVYIGLVISIAVVAN